MGKPLNSHDSYRLISLTSCVSNLFVHVILFFILFFSRVQPHFLSPPGLFSLWSVYSRSILYLSLSILDRFNKPKLGSRKILASVDFSKAFNFVWHSSLSYTSLFRMVSILALLSGFNLSFVTGALAWFFKSISRFF